MKHTQADLFAQDSEPKTLPESQISRIRTRLEAALAKLEEAATFPWSDPLDAVHLENRFQRDTEMLGTDGAALWVRFDREMDRLYATQSDRDPSTVMQGACSIPTR